MTTVSHWILCLILNSICLYITTAHKLLNGRKLLQTQSSLTICLLDPINASFVARVKTTGGESDFYKIIVNDEFDNIAGCAAFDFFNINDNNDNFTAIDFKICDGDNVTFTTIAYTNYQKTITLGITTLFSGPCTEDAYSVDPMFNVMLGYNASCQAISIDNTGVVTAYANDKFNNACTDANHAAIVQDVTCDSIESDHNTCVIYVPVFTPYIYFKNDPPDVECDSDYQNCEIYIHSYSKGSIYCPLNTSMSSCIINCEFWCEDLIIYAPDNGGSLQINGAHTMYLCMILSSPGTANIIIDNSVSNNYGNGMNIVDGRYVTRDLNVSCFESAFCYHTTIICGSAATCNVNCSGNIIKMNQGICENMIVNKTEATSNINWYCDNSVSNACLNAKLECNYISKDSISLWTYDASHNWRYNTADCVTKAPAWITCDWRSFDTCYISRSYLDIPHTIQCAGDVSHCLVKLGEDKFWEANDWPVFGRHIIHCPSSSQAQCGSCIIQCINDYACYNITIYGNNCLSLVVHFKAFKQDWTTIYAPGNGGGLTVFTNFTRGYPGVIFHPMFANGNIFSQPGTKYIVAFFHDSAAVNIIDGTYVTDYLNLTCGPTARCEHNTIICPNDASCNIHCRGLCHNETVKAIEGIYDVNWQCDTSCNDSILYCNHNFNRSSTWKLTNNTWQLEDHSKDTGCVNIPTEYPTLSPTESTPAPIIKNNLILIIIIVIVSILLCAFAVGGSVFYFKYYKVEQQSLYIRNALVVLIGIGEYEEEMDEKNDEIGGHLSDLHGIDQDILNMVHLFHDELNYDIFPSKYLDDIKND
eukprot:239912_1